MKQRHSSRIKGMVSVTVETPASDFAVNLRRLIYFHHWSAREAAKTLGVSEHAMSAWLTEKRKPGLDSIMRIAGIYDIDPRLLSGDQLEFARELADPERIRNAESNIRSAGRRVGVAAPRRRKRALKEVEEIPPA